MIKVKCPHGHFIATVEVTDTGLNIHGDRCGLVWLYAPTQEITRVHARCFARRCTYDGSIDYAVLHAELAATRHAEYRLAF